MKKPLLILTAAVFTLSSGLEAAQHKNGPHEAAAIKSADKGGPTTNKEKPSSRKPDKSQSTQKGKGPIPTAQGKGSIPSVQKIRE